MKLVIVESPTKAKTIGKFLGSNYEIIASMGHVMDLPKSTLGVDIEHDFAPQYEISPDKKKILTELKKLAKTADGVILATDPDREGEAIAYHIREILPISNTTNKQIQRITFHEITKEAIEEALKNPGQINTQLVNAQTARRVLDRLVGYKLSPILWQKVRRGLSAGRVQSVALRLIVEREKEIEKFHLEDYWTIAVTLRQKETEGIKETNETVFDLIEIDNQKIEVQEKLSLYDGEYTFAKTIIDSQQKADNIVKDLPTKEFIVKDVVKKETKRSPQPPFTTSTLQQQAALRFGYSGKRTMSLAQKLYEEGYITYHRTDSLTISSSAIFSMRSYAEKEFGEKYIPDKPRFYATKSKNAQEAHEAIRPTQINRQSSIINDQLGRDFAKLYELIYRRALASQMSDALIESTTVLVGAGQYLFKTTGSVLLFDGFLKVNPYALEDKKLPNFQAKESLSLLNQLAEKHTTTPPPRYNDASLIKSLEEAGIGRPSTYATIISTIESRQYIERDQKRFVPTSVGVAVNDFLVKNFSDIDDIPFTAEMENELDEVASGQREWVQIMKDFYTPFEKKLEVVKKADRVEIPVETTGEKCPKDGGDLVIRVGRFGKFISCKNFPTCDYKKQYVQDSGYICPKDQGKIIVKKTRKGRPFYGCSNYPNCDYAAWNLSDVKKGIIPEKKEWKKTTKAGKIKRKKTPKKA